MALIDLKLEAWKNKLLDYNVHIELDTNSEK